ncbi:MAG: hypothetical protein HQK83_12390 [Fibrobacteria bacterium]|nr:hypothetical protein [Fibrobacteria bacterium]
MADNELGIFWKGPWPISNKKVPYEITDQEGLFMVLTGKKEVILRRWKVFEQIIYIGHASNIRKGLRDNPEWNGWEQHNQKSLLVKVATFTKPVDFIELNYCLNSNIKPLCYKPPAHTEVQPKKSVLNIRNKGQKWPLGETYKCNLPIPIPTEGGEEEEKPKSSGFLDSTVTENFSIGCKGKSEKN